MLFKLTEKQQAAALAALGPMLSDQQREAIEAGAIVYETAEDLHQLQRGLIRYGYILEGSGRQEQSYPVFDLAVQLQQLRSQHTHSTPASRRIGAARGMIKKIKSEMGRNK